jgi:hypothetical protein
VIVIGRRAGNVSEADAPRKTPAEITEKLNREINVALADPKNASNERLGSSRHSRYPVGSKSGHSPMPAFMRHALARSSQSGRTAQTLLSPTAPVRGFNARLSLGLNEQESAGWQMRLSFWPGGE